MTNVKKSVVIKTILLPPTKDEHFILTIYALNQKSIPPNNSKEGWRNSDIIIIGKVGSDEFLSLIQNNSFVFKT